MSACPCGADLPGDCALVVGHIDQALPGCLRDGVPDEPEPEPKPQRRKKESPKLRRRTLSEVRSRSTQFLVPGLVPLRTLTLLAGVGGLGKSTWLAAIAAGVTTGQYGDPAGVLVVTYEDTAEEQWRPRVLASEGDVAHVHCLEVEVEDGGVVVLPRDLEALEDQIEETGTRLVVVDPIVAAIDGTVDTFKDQHVRLVLGKLVAVAEQTGCAVVGVAHLNKAPSRDAYVRIANSVAFYNAARSVVLVVEGEEEDERIVAQVKSNWSRHKRVELHKLIETVLPEEIDASTGRPVVIGRMVFREALEDYDHGSVLAEPERASGPELSRATAFLMALPEGVEHTVAEVFKAAEAEHLGSRTVRRAAYQLRDEGRLEVRQIGVGKPWVWCRPRLASRLATVVPQEPGQTDEARRDAASQLTLAPSGQPGQPPAHEDAHEAQGDADVGPSRPSPAGP